MSTETPQAYKDYYVLSKTWQDGNFILEVQELFVGGNKWVQNCRLWGQLYSQYSLLVWRCSHQVELLHKQM